MRDNVIKVFKGFLRDPNEKSLLLTGPWGTGKTYLVDECVAEHFSNFPNQQYAKLSLYDVESLTQLQVGLIGSLISSTQRASKWRKPLKTWGAMLPTGNFEASISVLAKELLAGKLVCLDDFERRTSSLELRTIVGFLDTLINAHGCKVVVIANVDKLTPEDQKTLHAIAEKTFQYRVQLSSNVEWVAKTAIGGRVNSISEYVEKCLIDLRVDNVRIANDIVRRCEQFLELTTGIKPQIVEDRIRSICIAVCSFNSMDDFPDTQFLLGFMRHFRAPDDADRDQIDRWRRRLLALKYSMTDSLDVQLIEGVGRGYFDANAVAAELVKLNEASTASDVGLREAWQHFHNSLDPDSDKFAAIMANGLRSSMTVDSINNVNSTIRLIRSVGHEELANTLVDEFIVARSHEPVRFFDVTDDPFLSKDDVDVELSKALAAAHASKTSELDPNIILAKAAKEERLEEEELVRLTLLSPEELLENINAFELNGLSEIVDRILKLPTPMSPADGPRVVLRDRMIEILEKLAAESEVNRVRVQRKYLPPEP